MGNLTIGRYFFYQIIFPLVAAVFLIVLEIAYCSRKKLPFLSTKYFTMMMIFAGIYIGLDIACIHSVVYMENLSYHYVKLIHQLFVASLNTMLLSIYLYVDIFNSDGRKSSKVETTAAIIIYIASIIFVLLGDIKFSRTIRGVYSYGTIPESSYLISIIYIVFTIIKSLKVSITSYFHPKQKYIIITMMIFVIFMSLKAIFPALRITSIGVSLMILVMFMSFETTRDYINTETGAFTTEALKMILVEKVHKNRKFYVLNIDIEDVVEVERTLGSDAVSFIIKNIVSYLKKLIKIPVTISNNGITIVIDKKKMTEDRLYEIVDQVEQRFNEPWIVKDNKVILNTHCDFIVYPEDCYGIETISDFLKLIWDCHKFTNSDNFIRRVNKKMIETKRRNDQILSIVQDAIENDGIEMYYQPIYSIPERKFTNVEALVRLKDNKTLGFISPEEFIPIVEKNGLIMELSNIIFEKIFQFVKSGKLKKYGVTHIELNLSAIQAIDISLPTQMSYLMEKYNIDPKMINLEITETTMIVSAKMLKKNIDVLTGMGCSFSMDDFGTGYSNLAQMAQVAYQFIKADKSLLWPCFNDENPDKDKAVIVFETAIKMILNLRKEIIAEGVETEEQYNYLSSIGVDYIQGFYFSKPLCEKDYIEFLKKNNC